MYIGYNEMYIDFDVLSWTEMKEEISYMAISMHYKH
jgi:hypothetical protein